VGLLDSTAEEPSSKLRRYLVTAAVFILLGWGGLWWLLRFHAEKTVVYHFLNSVAAGNLQQAYGMWSPSRSYAFPDFVSDWGPDGYYGPVKSFNVTGTYHPQGGSTGVVVIVDLSPYAPYPEKDDALRRSKSKEVRLWVQFKDHTVEFPPPQFESR
jgi:hypothetical protein